MASTLIMTHCVLKSSSYSAKTDTAGDADKQQAGPWWRRENAGDEKLSLVAGSNPAGGHVTHHFPSMWEAVS